MSDATFIGLPQRLLLPAEQWRGALRQFACELRVAMPGTIEKYNADEQTAQVRLGLRETVNQAYRTRQVEMPLLDNVPIVVPRAGGFLLTLPVAKGDECLVVFADMCIDSWWESGGVQDPLERRRHDLSDAFAILGPWSQARKVSSYSTSSAQLRNEAGTVKIDLAADQVTVTAPKVVISGATQVDISASGATKIEGKTFLTHTHSDPQGGVTGGVS